MQIADCIIDIDHIALLALFAISLRYFAKVGAKLTNVLNSLYGHVILWSKSD